MEGLLRGYRGGLLSSADYTNLCQCENLDDIKLHLVRRLSARQAGSCDAAAAAGAALRGGGNVGAGHAGCESVLGAPSFPGAATPGR